MTDEKKARWVSPSQLKTFRGCKRKWAFKYIGKRSEPPGKGATFGTEVHTVAEDWLREGIKPPDTVAGRVFSQVLTKGWLPPPGPANNVEGAFWISDERAPGVFLHGYRDLVHTDGDGRIVVVDHKTTKDRRWILSADKFKQDPQVLIYAATAFANHEIDEVFVRFIYYVVKWDRSSGQPVGGNGVEKIDAVLGVDLLDSEEWHQILDEVREIRDLRDRADDEIEDIEPPDLDGLGDAAKVKARWEAREEQKRRALPLIQEVDPNVSFCGAFGGCPYLKDCNIDAGKSLASLFKTAG